MPGEIFLNFKYAPRHSTVFSAILTEMLSLISYDLNTHLSSCKINHGFISLT